MAQVAPFVQWLRLLSSLPDQLQGLLDDIDQYNFLYRATIPELRQRVEENAWSDQGRRAALENFDRILLEWARQLCKDCNPE